MNDLNICPVCGFHVEAIGPYGYHMCGFGRTLHLKYLLEANEKMWARVLSAGEEDKRENLD